MINLTEDIETFREQHNILSRQVEKLESKCKTFPADGALRMELLCLKKRKLATKDRMKKLARRASKE